MRVSNLPAAIVKTVLLFATCALTVSVHAQEPAARTAVSRLEKNIPSLIRDNYIPALSAAYIREGKPVWHAHFGTAQATDKTPVTDSTIFEAASLSKVATAYAALRLVDAGRLHLDTPLYAYLGNNYEIGDDPRIKGITARRVLSHSAGFPNWRNRGDSLLPVNFDPGSRFGYSGEGFVFLAKVMEKITGMPLEQLLQQSVFVPLGMTHSSMVFHPAQRQLYATRHSWLGKPSWLADYPNANAAASLRTTAMDYATFLAAVLNGTGLSESSRRQMFASQVKVDTAKPQLAWGLGIGLEITPKGRYCWHWGDQGDAKALFVADIDTRNGLVYFTNSANGLAIAPEMTGLALGNGPRDILAYVKYAEFDPAAVQLVDAIRSKGAAAALAAYLRDRQHTLSEDVMNNMGYMFLREKKYPEAIAVFTQNSKDYPASYNVWDSLAEALMENGDKAPAIQYYEKSLALNPDNKNAVDQLKKLRP